MDAVANHVKYEWLIIRVENIEGRLTLFAANTREETDVNVCTIRLKLDREQTDTVKGVLYIGTLIYVEGRIDEDEKGIHILI